MTKRLTLCIAIDHRPSKIERCLASIAPIIDEIIIADMGITPSVHQLCLSYGARIIDCHNIAHVSDALNKAMEQVTGDWILWLHSNEYLKETTLFRFRDLLYATDVDLFLLHIIEFKRSKEGRLRMMDVAGPRLFRQQRGFRFIEKEDILLLNVDHTSRQGDRVSMQPFKINAEQRSQDSLNVRSVKRIEKAVSAEKYSSSWNYYELACQYFRIGEYQEVVRCLNKVIQIFLNKKSIPPAIIYKLKYAAVLDQVYFPDTVRGIELAVKMYPEFTDLHYYLGLIHLRQSQFEKAQQAFQRCVELGEERNDYFIRQGFGGYLAHYYRGVSLEKVRNLDESAHAYICSLSCYEAYTPAIVALKRLTTQGGIDLASCIREDVTLSLEHLKTLLESYQENISEVIV